MLTNKIARDYWLKKFTEEEVSKLNAIFNSCIITPIGKSLPDLSDNEDLRDLFSRYGNFIHPERDIEDETVGIEPKTIKKYLNKHNNSFQSLKKLLQVMTIMFLHNNRYDLFNKYLDEDGFYDWDSIFKELTKSGDKKYARSHVDIVRDITGMHTDNYLSKDNDLTYLTLFYKEKNIFQYIEDKYKKWDKHFSITPKNKTIFLLCEPKYFSMKILKKILSKLGVENINDLEEFDQIKVALTMNLYDKDLIEEGYSVDYSKFFSKKRLVKKELNFFKEFDIDKNIVINRMSEEQKHKLINNVAKIKDKEVKKQYVNQLTAIWDEIDNIHYVLEFMDTLLDMEYKQIKAIYMYHTDNINYLMKSIIDIYKSRSKEKEISEIDITIDSYTLSVLDSDSYDGFFLGDYVDCCQTLHKENEDSGVQCIIAGYKNKRNGFLKIEKSNQVYAESWFWVGVDSKGNEYLCLDSIENVKSTREQKEIYLDLIENFSEIVLEMYPNIKYVCVGDSYRLSDNIFKEREYQDISDKINFWSDFSYSPDQNEYKPSYTDTDQSKNYKTRMIEGEI